MDLKYLREKEDIEMGIKALVNTFISEYPYYLKWIKKKQVDFENFKKEIVAMMENQTIVDML